jgi:hypothetical protein
MKKMCQQCSALPLWVLSRPTLPVALNGQAPTSSTDGVRGCMACLAEGGSTTLATAYHAQ